jgi:hypothetical protein
MDVKTLRAALRVSGDFLCTDDPDSLREDAIRDAMSIEGAEGEVHEIMKLSDALIGFALAVQRHTITGKPLPPLARPPKKVSPKP